MPKLGKLTAVIAAAIVLLSFSGCGGGSGGSADRSITPTPTPTGHNEWTWVSGPKLANQAGVYGSQGTASANNVPVPREQPASWTDASGNFWLFGGMAAPTQTSDIFFNDLWRFSGGQWTWVGGSNTPNQPGIYGSKGLAAPANIPGARFAAANWTDLAGTMWLFGGLGLDVNGTSNYLDDLWKYNAGQWTWVGGSSVGTQNRAGIYGTQGVPAPVNQPGARSDAVSWTDRFGNFWLFGGLGIDSAGTLGNLNDLWKYSAGQWTWMSGSNLANQTGVYGSLGTAAPGNIPGARIEAAGWTDSAGNLWLFGGATGSNGSFFVFNDLWKYSSGQWTWVSGSNLFNQRGTYGTQGTAAASNTPGSRVLATAWTDASGNFWLFGGDSFDSAGALGQINDLWKFSGGQWTWVNGSNLISRPGAYGTQGTAAANNTPGARWGTASWVDGSGNLWLFGGDGYDANGTLGFMNDLWKYQP